MKPSKDLKANLEYRAKVLALCASDKQAQEEFWIASARDICFWLDTFGWTFAPKFFPDQPHRPFILWDYQEDALHKILDAIGVHDLLIEKSRDMGASWLVVAAFTHQILFNPSQLFLVGSRKQELVDKTGDPKTILWKGDYLIDKLPIWMRPRNLRRNLCHIENEDNGSVIDGESTNDDFARGDRRQAILLDEFAAVDNGHQILSATRDATPCRIFLSTPQGAAGAYYDTRRKLEVENPERILRLHWSLHPIKAKGLYYDEQAKPRSPWYDEETRRAASPQEIAQELDIDYAASSFKVLDPKILSQLIAEHPIRPFTRGELTYSPGNVGDWYAVDSGRLLLWTNVREDGFPPADDDYVCGCDISMGKSGELSSRSVAAVWSRKTYAKVGEFKTPDLDPADFAEYVIALCKWFRGSNGKGAYLIWESNGPGHIFQKRITENMRYTNIYYRATEQRVGRPKQKVPGWASTPESKRLLLLDYFKSLRDKRMINRSEEALMECGQYDHFPNGEIAHVRSRNSIDPSATGQNHGDIVIADALACRGLQDFQAPEPEEKRHVSPYSFENRRAAYKRSQRQESSLY